LARSGRNLAAWGGGVNGRRRSGPARGALLVIRQESCKFVSYRRRRARSLCSRGTARIQGLGPEWRHADVAGSGSQHIARGALLECVSDPTRGAT